MPSSKVGSAHVNARIAKAHATVHFIQRKGLFAGQWNSGARYPQTNLDQEKRWILNNLFLLPNT
jgi:hypothetical protein